MILTAQTVSVISDVEAPADKKSAKALGRQHGSGGWAAFTWDDVRNGRISLPLYKAYRRGWEAAFKKRMESQGVSQFPVTAGLIDSKGNEVPDETRSFKVTGDADQIDEFERLLHWIQNLSSWGHSAAAHVYVDGDGAAHLSFEGLKQDRVSEEEMEEWDGFDYGAQPEELNIGFGV